MSVLISWFVLAFAVWLTAVILPGVKIKGFGSAILVAALFGVLNFFLGWLFFTVFAIATLGIALLLAFLTRWIVNAILLKMVDAMTDRIQIDGVRWALIAALVMSCIGSVTEWALQAVGIV